MERMSSRLDPAYSVIRKFDVEGKPGKSGTVVLAERLNVDRSTVQKWTMASERRGTGGFIPYRYHDEIVTFAEELGIPFDRSEFLSRRAEVSAA